MPNLIQKKNELEKFKFLLMFETVNCSVSLYFEFDISHMRFFVMHDDCYRTDHLLFSTAVPVTAVLIRSVHGNQMLQLGKAHRVWYVTK